MSHVPYSSVIGSLMYVMVCTRPDTAHALEQVYVKTMEGESRHNKEGFQVFLWNYYLWIMIPRKTRIGQSVGNTYIYLC
jgi:hypothetical protein